MKVCPSHSCVRAQNRTSMPSAVAPMTAAPAARRVLATTARHTPDSWARQVRRMDWGMSAPGASRRQMVVRANWGAPVDFQSAKVLQNKQTAADLHQITVDVGSSIAAGYSKPGQYIQAKIGESKPGFFAIASAPDPNNEGVLELLIKKQPGSTAEVLCGLKESDDIMVSPVQGKGFPIDRIPSATISTVLMFATGSGISPLKAVIESGMLDVESRKDVRLYYGTRSEGSTAYLDLIPAWEALGVKVTQVYSGDEKRYIQAVFEQHAAELKEPAGVAALLCGQKDMCEAVTGLLTKQGVSADAILKNF